MPVICPTVLANQPDVFREQMERLASFATRVHIDLTDGEFAPDKTVDLAKVWWPHSVLADLHVMYKHPEQHLSQLIKLSPHMIIVHAEADGDFAKMANKLHKERILIGVALLPGTSVDAIAPALGIIDHVLVFSGDLGKFGGQVDLGLLNKVKELKILKPALEIGWDGGVNRSNAKQLAMGGVDVINVGGFIQQSAGPHAAYQQLVNLV